MQRLTGRLEIGSGSPTGRGAVKRSAKRRCKHIEVITKYSSATTRKLSARMPLPFGERLGLVAMVVASRESRKASNKIKSAARPTMYNTTVDSHQTRHCWWKSQPMYSVNFILSLVYLSAKYEAKITSKM